jgi:hypothetical protein
MRRCMHFRHGEQLRRCLDALRLAKGPMTTCHVREFVMKAKGDAEEAAFRTLINEQVRVALSRLAAKGMVRKVITAPEVWWEAVDLWGQPSLF